MNFILEQFKISRLIQLAVAFFLLLSVWWFYMYFTGIIEGSSITWFLLIYPLPTLFGGLYGLQVSKKWGGIKSVFGRSLLYFALGFLAQTLGQYLYNYYQIYVGIDVPYPSIGDFFYFGSVILYVLGVYELARIAGVRLSVKSLRGKLIAFLIPILVLLAMYMVMLKGYEPDMSNLFILFLDFGWLIGQAIYLSIAILTLLVSKDILGGIMRKPIMLLIIALVAQFFADFYFSYEASREIITYYPGGVTDYIYALGYLLMTIALVSIGNMFYKVQES